MVAPVAVLVETFVEDAPRVIGHGLPVVHIVVDLLLHSEGGVLDLAKLDVELAAPDPLAEGLALHLRELELVLLIAVDILELGGIDRVEAVGDQGALERDHGPVELGGPHPRRRPVHHDPAGQGPFLFRRRQLLVAGVANVAVLPVKQREGIVGLVAFGLDRNQLVLAGGGAGLADVVVDDRLAGLIEEVARRKLSRVGPVALDKEIADPEEVVHYGPVISLADRNISLVLVVLQAGIELAEVLVLQGVVGIDIVQARGQVVIEVGPRNDLVLADGRNPVARGPAQSLVQPPVTVGRDGLVFAPGEHLVSEVPFIWKGGVDGVETGIEEDDRQQPAVREAGFMKVDQPESHQGDDQEENRHEDVVVIGEVKGSDQDCQVDDRGHVKDPEGVAAELRGVLGENADRHGQRQVDQKRPPVGG